jgi:hypothetical protein
MRRRRRFRLAHGRGDRLSRHATLHRAGAASAAARSWIACARTMPRCMFSQKSGLLPNTRARMSAVAGVRVHRLLHSALTRLR